MNDKITDNSYGPASHEEELHATHTSAPVWQTREKYCERGFRGLFTSTYVALCAAFSALGGLLFGYDQGVVSVILVEPQFIARFGRIAQGASGAGFWKGLLTAMIELGALLGALNQGWIADKFSRKYSIMIAVCVFTVGSALQTSSIAYGMLVVARFIGGLGIGMVCNKAPTICGRKVSFVQARHQCCSSFTDRPLGQLSMVAPLYISEISPPEIRGSLLVLEEFSIVLGIVIAFWITYGTQYIQSEWSWVSVQ